jgi:hypothetical protein
VVTFPEFHEHVVIDAAVKLLVFRWRVYFVTAWVLIPSLLPWCRPEMRPG